MWAVFIKALSGIVRSSIVTIKSKTLVGKKCLKFNKNCSGRTYAIPSIF